MTTPAADPIGQLSRALGVTAQVIDGLGPNHWDAPTPCADWTVRDLVGHLTGGNWLFVSALRGTDGTAGQPGPAASDPDRTGADRADADRALPGEFRASADALLDAFAEPGALERVVTVPFGTVPGQVAVNLRITEALVHGWDLARASGQRPQFPEDVAGPALAFTRATLPAVPAGRSPFGSPQPAPDNAAPIDRLAALLGRALA